MKAKSSWILLFLGGVLFFSCQQKATPGSYDESLDDLIMGVYFGMDKQDFFDHCWDMNQDGMTHHGTIGNMVMYIDSLNFEPKAVVNFYPKFVDNKISEMPMIFYYHAWSPWNKNELKQDSLQMEVVRFFEKKYDVKMETKESRPGYDIYYKFINPIMVRVYKDQDEMLVKADILNDVYMEDESE